LITYSLSTLNPSYVIQAEEGILLSSYFEPFYENTTRLTEELRQHCPKTIQPTSDKSRLVIF